MTSVPSDVIAPTSEGSLDAVTNPINGRRGPGRPPENVQCVAETTSTCLTGALDALGFDITSASSESDERSVWMEAVLRGLASCIWHSVEALRASQQDVVLRGFRPAMFQELSAVHRAEDEAPVKVLLLDVMREFAELSADPS